jgi:carbon monoxide dehydrogenase subunit G
MRMTGEEIIAAGSGDVWRALNDPQVLRQCIPGCQTLERASDEQLRAVLEIKIGPIGARFNSVVTLCDVRPAQGYTLIGEGQGGTVGSAKATIKVRLEEAGASTKLSYELDAQVGGRLAQLGGPIVDATAKRFATSFFKRLREMLGSSAEVVANVPVNEVALAAHSAPAPYGTFPYAWVLAVVLAALVGFLVGRGQ